MLLDLEKKVLLNIDKLRLNFCEKNFGIAVSGGVDSMSLMFILWKIFGSCNAHVFSVDHGLRRSSAEELVHVEHMTRSLKMKFYPLYWQGYLEKSNIQSKARYARYELICAKCRTIGIRTLFLAHQKDDFLENFCIRENRKSSVFGLSSSYVFFFNGVRILRPLFNVSKSELVSYAKDQNIKYLNDPSNQSMRYQRNVIRTKLSGYDQIKKRELEKKINSVNLQAHKLNTKLIESIANSTKICNMGFAVLNLQVLHDCSEVIRIQILLYVITMISSKNFLPRFRNIQNILNKLFSDQIFSCTLHGCMIEKCSNELFIYKEIHNIDGQKYKVQNFLENSLGEFVWDQRFLFKFNSYDFKSYSVRKKMETLSIVSFFKSCFKREIPYKNHIFKLPWVGDMFSSGSAFMCKKILDTIPVVEDIEKNIFIPHIDYCRGLEFLNNVRVTFRPSFVFRFTHFFWGIKE